jgi:hypothetical protein
MASDGIELEQVMERDMKNCFVGRGSERQLDCTDLRSC